MAETPTFGRYAEIPHDKMTPEQQEGYRAMIGALGRHGALSPSRNAPLTLVPL